MHIRSSQTLQGFAWALVALTILSGSLVMLRLGVTTSLSAYDLAALRFGTAALLLLGIVWRRGWALTKLGVWGVVALVLCQGAPYILVLSFGLKFAPSVDAGAINPGLMAVYVAIFAWVYLNEPMSKQKAMGICAVLLGTVLFSDVFSIREASKGHLIFAITGCMWASYAILVRKAGLQALHATAIVAVGSALFYLPLYFAMFGGQLLQAPVKDIAVQAVYQGILTSGVALYAFTKSTEYLGASSGAAMTALIPLTTMIIGAVFLGEAGGPFQVFAAVLIGLGVLLTLTASKTSPPGDTRTAPLGR